MAKERPPKSMEPIDIDELLGSPSRRDRRRFRLIEIAFDNILKSEEMRKMSRPGIGEVVVELADAVLAAMDATPDTGPSADEIERRARALAGELLTDMEVSMGPVLVDLRAKLQEAIKQDAEAYAQNPTTDERVLGYREGDEVATRMVLRLIDEAMETTGEAEDDEQKGIT